MARAKLSVKSGLDKEGSGSRWKTFRDLG